MVDDRQDIAEALDADKVSDEEWDEGELGDYPPDAPLGVDAYGVTPQEDQIDEPLAERVADEEPDPLREELDRAARLPDPGLVPGSLDPQLDLGLGGTAADQDEVGLLVDPAGWLDDEAEAVAEAAPVAGPTAIVPAEEDALHLTADPPFHATDGYVEDVDDQQLDDGQLDDEQIDDGELDDLV